MRAVGVLPHVVAGVLLVAVVLGAPDERVRLVQVEYVERAAEVREVLVVGELREVRPRADHLDHLDEETVGVADVGRARGPHRLGGHAAEQIGRFPAQGVGESLFDAIGQPHDGERKLFSLNENDGVVDIRILDTGVVVAESPIRTGHFIAPQLTFSAS